ncbi:MAG TPA: hypothetical protein PLR99_01990 [Polyangiaceae bacterium]|nr:hypothetical protein [Polyangiaceae bacterium]
MRPSPLASLHAAFVAGPSRRSPRSLLSSLAPLAALALATACSIHVGGDVQGSGEAQGSGLSYAAPARPRPPALTTHCSPAPALFAQAAVCVCGGMSHAGKLTTIARPGESADVGVVGELSFAAGTHIDGSLRSGSDISFAGDLDVRDHALAGGDFSGAGDLAVGADLAVGGRLSGAGSLRVGGTLRAGEGVSFAGRQVVGARGPYVDPGGPPCACDPGSLYDVAAAVRAARDANDNARAGLGTDARLVAKGSPLTLRDGRYYFSGASELRGASLRIEGAVQLYLEGDLTTLGEGQLALGAGATLDLFVDGALTTVGRATFGDPTRPEALRLYVGGKNAKLTLAGKEAFYGLVYAPEAEVSFAGAATVDGALFARELSYAGSLTVRGARVSTQPAACEERAPADPTAVPAPAPAPTPTPSPAPAPAPTSSSPPPCDPQGS